MNVKGRGSTVKDAEIQRECMLFRECGVEMHGMTTLFMGVVNYIGDPVESAHS